MTALFYLLGYLAFIGFISLAIRRLRTFRKATPLHVRWELYPVPHEGDKAKHGGSYMEEVDWWKKKRHLSHLEDIKGILEEVLFLHATFKHNLKLWACTYPFHLGMYLLMGGTIILIISTLLQIFGIAPDSVLITAIGHIINGSALFGSFCIIVGGIALIQRRRHDSGLKRYTTNEHYLNLGSFILFGVLGLLACLFTPSFFDQASTFMHGLLTLSFTPMNNTLFSLHMLVGFALLIMIPMTNMQHLILKYDMYHNIRWEDTPTPFSSRNQKKLMEALQLKVSWSADHIQGNGQKTWVDVATANPAASETDN